MNALCELLVSNEQSCDRGTSLSWPSGVCSGTTGDVEPTGVFDNPSAAGLWLAVAPMVASMGRRNFTDLQIHLNNDSPEHTDQGDVSPSVLLVFGNFSDGAFRLCPPGKPTISLKATQHVFEFDGSIPHSIGDIAASPSGQCRPRWWSIVCHTRFHFAAEEADLHARALDMADIIVKPRAGRSHRRSSSDA